jgi:hypothetical protein
MKDVTPGVAKRSSQKQRGTLSWRDSDSLASGSLTSAAVAQASAKRWSVPGAALHGGGATESIIL